MKKKYRLIQVIESLDNRVYKEIDIYELSPITIENNEFRFTSTPNSSDNDYFVFFKGAGNEIFNISKHEEIIEININEFKLNLIKTPEGLRKTYFSNDLDKLRCENKDSWGVGAVNEINSGKQIAYGFSHIEFSNFTYDENDENNVVPSEFSDIEFDEEENFVIVDKESVVFCFKTDRGILTRLKGKIVKIVSDDFGMIIKIDTLSDWALSENVPISYEFNVSPLQPLKESEKNLVITVFGNLDEPRIRTQWSLLFGKYLGAVQFN